MRYHDVEKKYGVALLRRRTLDPIVIVDNLLLFLWFRVIYIMHICSLNCGEKQQKHVLYVRNPMFHMM